MSWSVEVADRALDDFRVQFIKQISKGFQKYGTKLKTFNTHSMYRYGLEELVDAVNYFKCLDMQYQKVRSVAWAVVKVKNGLHFEDAYDLNPEIKLAIEKLENLLNLSNTEEDPIQDE